MRETFHLVPETVWARAGGAVRGDSLGEGFIHCTDGLEALGVTFDRYYADPRPFLALTLDLDALDVPWRYDVPGSPYPHIYGPIDRSAIRAVSRVERAPGRPVLGTGAGLVALAPHDREGQRDPAALVVADVAVAAPPVDRVLGDGLEAQVRAQERRDDLAERPGAGELPALVGFGDREVVDVLRRPALRRLGAAEVVVVGRDPAAVLVGVEEPLGRDGPRTGRIDRPGRGAGRSRPPRRRGPGAR